MVNPTVVFQSTSPVRGTTAGIRSSVTIPPISIHVPREGDDFAPFATGVMNNISIHVPREGDDGVRPHIVDADHHFNPRPP